MLVFVSRRKSSFCRTLETSRYSFYERKKRDLPFRKQQKKRQRPPHGTGRSRRGKERKKTTTLLWSPPYVPDPFLRGKRFPIVGGRKGGEGIFVEKENLLFFERKNF